MRLVRLRRLRHRLVCREDETFFLSVISASELLHGVHRALVLNIRARHSAFVEAVLVRFPLLPVDVAVARAHARLWAGLMAEGRLIGPHDLWLAATCLAYGLTMVAGNVREFERVPGLDVETWSLEQRNGALPFLTNSRESCRLRPFTFVIETAQNTRCSYNPPYD